MRFVAVVVALAVAAVVATYVRYQSLYPCDWLEHDMGRQTGLPPLVVQARIRAGFLADGIARPDAYDCILRWWEFRLEELSGDS